jgi:pimeloyl-ACP methyl ester carboxylesterase
VGDWSQGVRVENARSLVGYWERYDWRRFESELNRFPQFVTGIDGLDIHFIHVRSETGWTVSRIASAWVELMKRLGYTRWAAQGDDWGAVVTTALGAMQPGGLLGIHLNTQYAFPAQIPDTLSPEQRYAVETLALYTGDLGGANHLQARSRRLLDSPWRSLPLVRQPGSTTSFHSKTDVAATCAFLVSDEAGYITGQLIGLNGGRHL